MSLITGAFVEEGAEAGDSDNDSIEESRVRVQIKPMNTANRTAVFIPIHPFDFIAIRRSCNKRS